MNKFILIILVSFLMANCVILGSTSECANGKDYQSSDSFLPYKNTYVPDSVFSGDLKLDLREAIDIIRYKGRDISELDDVLCSVAVNELKYASGTRYSDTLYRDILHGMLKQIHELKICANDTIYCYLRHINGNGYLTVYSQQDSIYFINHDRYNRISKRFEVGKYLGNWNAGIIYEDELYRMGSFPSPHNLDFRVIICESAIERVDGFRIKRVSKSSIGDTGFDRDKIIEIKEVVPSPHIPQNNSSIIKRDSVNTK